MLALHTTYDPRIPTNTLAFYGEQVAVAGFSQNLVQQYVKRDGHCNLHAAKKSAAPSTSCLVGYTSASAPPPACCPRPAPPNPHNQP